MSAVEMSEAETSLSSLVRAIENGNEKEIVILRDGKPVARITEFGASRQRRRLGQAKGRYPDMSLDDFNTTDPAIEALFTGRGE